jgi:hypothetical protein
MLKALLALLFKLLRRSQLGAKIWHQLCPNSTFGESHDAKRPRHDPLPHGHNLADMNFTSGLRRHVIDFHRAGAAGIRRKSPRFVNPHGPEPLINSGSGLSTAAVRFRIQNDREPVRFAVRSKRDFEVTYFLVRPNSFRIQSSINVFS